MSIGEPIEVELKASSSGSSIYFFIKYKYKVVLDIDIGDEVRVDINGNSFYQTVRNVGGNASVTVKKEIVSDLVLISGQRINVNIEKVGKKRTETSSKSVKFNKDEIKFLKNPESIKDTVKLRNLKRSLTKKGDKLLDFILKVKRVGIELDSKKLEELHGKDKGGRES